VKGIVLLCLDIGAAVMIVAWDLIQQFSEKLYNSIQSGVERCSGACLRLAGHLRAFFSNGSQISSVPAYLNDSLRAAERPKK